MYEETLSAEQKNLTQATLIDVTSTHTESNEQLDGSSLLGGELVWIPLSFMMIWTLVVLICSDAWKVAREGMLTVRTFQQVPCKNCRFFSNNAYIKCAVQPSIVLTKQAMGCSDYHSYTE